MTQLADPKVYFGNQSDSYGIQYQTAPDGAYHPNQYRLKIFLKHLEEIQPKNILDIGCGSGEPLIHMLKRGYNVQAIDGAAQMVSKAKENLRTQGLNESFVKEMDMQDLSTFNAGEFDCITAMGSLYYAHDFAKAMRNVSRVIEKDGTLIASFRNDLFSLFSNNEYTLDFLFSNCFPANEFSDAIMNEVRAELDSKIFKNKYKMQSIDADKVHNLSHNPLTISSILSQYNFRLDSVKYYHFHPLPPIYKNRFAAEFDQAAKKLESPDDWRGLFMASCFVVSATKLS